MFDFSTLITDRAAADLENLRALLSTPMEDWTAEQMAQFNQAISKGAYNYTDLNRVTACMEYLDETLRAYGYETGYQRILVHPDEPESISLLPEGYTQLEYIQSSGSQYIDTGFKPNQDTRIVMDATPLNMVSENGGAFFFGSSFPIQENGFETYGFYNVFYAVYNSVQEGGTEELVAYERLLIDFNRNSCVVTRDDMTVFSHTFSQNTFTSSVDLCLFLLPRQSPFFGMIRLYNCRIFNNDVLIRDYIPCKNPSGEVGLYDTVNAQFYGNSGTGVFSPGPEITPGPDPSLDPSSWYEDDVPTAPQMAQYLNNVLSIWSTIMGDPTLPETMVNLTQEGANQIEAALIEINTAIEQIIAAMARSNSFTFWSGNRPFPTAYSNRGRNWAELDAMGTSWRNWQVATWYLLLYGNLEAEGDVT